MKLILTGTTGYIGAEVLRQSLINPKITSIVTLTRRPLSESKYTKNIDSSNAKLSTVIVKDLTADYPPDVLAQLKGADAVIWNLGTTPTKDRSGEVQRTAVQIPTTAVKAFTGLGRGEGQGPLRFVYTSGAGVSQDQEAQYWWKGEFRKCRGKAESIFAEAEVEQPKAFKTHIMRMGVVVHGLASVISYAPYMLTLQQAAASMIDVALNGNDKQILSSDEMKALGQTALSASS